MKKKEAERGRKKLVIILALIVVFLLGIMIYTVALRPTISGNVAKAQNQGYYHGYQFAIYQIMQQASQCQEVALIRGNRTMNIISVDCIGKIR